jgi:hypothetical protein
VQKRVLQKIVRRGRRAAPAGLFVLVLLTAGCASGTPDVSETPRRDLAGRPAVPTSAPPGSTAVPTSAGTLTAPSGSSSPTTAVPAASSPAHEQAGGAPRAGSPPYRVVASISDPRGDQGLDGPAYGDLRLVQMEDDGTSARVTVTLDGTLPPRPVSRESLGIGVDLYARTTQTEGDYQLFADGGPDGWFAYLETPRGFVRYPGTFALSGAQLVFTVPWTSLGARTSGAFSAFADWTQGGKAGTLGGNANSHDDAPALGSKAWSR